MNKISIITGGSSGLGKAIAKLLVEQGETVCIIARNENKINDVVEELGANALGYAGDLIDEQFVYKVFDDLTQKGYYVDHLYNVAGVGIYNEPQNVHSEEVVKTMNSNIIGLIVVSSEACRRMTDGGTIINVGSTASLKGNANESVYCASKWAVRGYTEALQAYYKKKNIHIIGVYPGGMNTPFWAEDEVIKPDTSKFMDPMEVAQMIVSNVAERRSLYNSMMVIDRR